MIFATVGTQLPFDRLLSALDTWAALHSDIPVLAQTGSDATHYAHLKCQTHLDQTAFAARMAEARVIVAHAGMGTILQAAEAGKPLILMPRRADMGEHRNDHQLATAAEMAVLSNVTVVHDATGLATALAQALQRTDACQPVLSGSAQPRLIEALKEFIWSEETRPAPAKRRLMGWVRA
jgi:UDP-N-acetylglucosamine transferase subunit ALG13